MTYQNILTEQRGALGVITLNRPAMLNALNALLMEELSDAIDTFEAQEDVKVILVKGSQEHFAVGADIHDLRQKNYPLNYAEDFITRHWERIAECRIPTIAAVAGLVMGAGCELAMMCDLIIAAENTRFSQPEISIGLMPGAGGTQRLPRAVGKAKAMDMCLTGRFMEVQEAEKLGLVSRVVSLDTWMHETFLVAERICQMSKPALMMIKESINRGYNQPLSEGLLSERRLFQAIFSLEDPHEGMRAFVEKRAPVFKGF